MKNIMEKDQSEICNNVVDVNINCIEKVLGARLKISSKDRRKGGYFHFSANRTPKYAHCCTQGDCLLSATLTLNAHIFSFS